MSIILSVCETRVWFIKKCLLRKILVTRHIHCFTDRCTILRACFLDNFSVHNFLTPDFVRYSNIRSISRNISTFVAVCSAILFPLRGWTFSHIEPYLPWRTERLAIFSLNFVTNIIGHYVTFTMSPSLCHRHYVTDSPTAISWTWQLTLKVAH